MTPMSFIGFDICLSVRGTLSERYLQHTDGVDAFPRFILFKLTRFLVSVDFEPLFNRPLPSQRKGVTIRWKELFARSAD